MLLARDGQLCSHEGPHLKKFCKILRPKAARLRMSNFLLKFKRRKEKVITSADVLFFSDTQRGATAKRKNIVLGLIHVRKANVGKCPRPAYNGLAGRTFPTFALRNQSLAMTFTRQKGGEIPRCSPSPPTPLIPKCASFRAVHKPSVNFSRKTKKNELKCCFLTSHIIAA